MARRRKNTTAPDSQNDITDILEKEDGSYFVIARAGTGKTTNLAKLVVEALGKYSPEDILCVTFTNSAEYEMRSKIKKNNKKEVADEKVFIGTIHKYCYSYLKSTPNPLSGFSLEEDDGIPNSQSKVRKCAAIIKQEKENHPKEVWINYLPYCTYKKKREALREACNQYIEEQQKNQKMNFDDILIQTYSLLLKERKKTSKPSYKLILVDEAQDLNPLQLGIIKLLGATDGCKFIYFGDFNQAIFSFLGTNDCLRDEFEKVKKEYTRELITNFRSPANLVAMFDRYVNFLNNEDEILKHLPKPKAIEGLTILGCKCHKDERIEVVRRIKTLTEKYKNNPYYRKLENKRSIVVLVRTHEEGIDFSLQLHSEGIMHLNLSGTDTFRSDAIKTFVSHLAVTCDEFNWMDWARILYQLKCGYSLSKCTDIVKTLQNLGIRPTDLLNYDNPTYIQTFLDEIKGDVVVYNRNSNNSISAETIRDGKTVISSFSQKIDDKGFPFAFQEYVKDCRILSFEEPREMEKTLSDYGVQDLVQSKYNHYAMDRLLGFRLQQDDKPLDFAEKFIKYVSIAGELLPKQQQYLSKVGAKYLCLKLQKDYRSIYYKTKDEILEKLPSTKTPVEIFKEAYNALLEANIISERDPFFYEAKTTEYNEDLRKGEVSQKGYEKFEHRWKEIEKNNNKQIKIKTDYFFKYLDIVILSRYSGDSLSDKLCKSINKIRTVAERDLCNPAFEKEKVVKKENEEEIILVPRVKEMVYVMTIHKSKGLAFTDVFITGANARKYKKRQPQRIIDEEKRLLYVALTRSSSNITVSYLNDITPFMEGICGYFKEEEVKEELDYE